MYHTLGSYKLTSVQKEQLHWSVQVSAIGTLVRQSLQRMVHSGATGVAGEERPPPTWTY